MQIELDMFQPGLWTTDKGEMKEQGCWDKGSVVSRSLYRRAPWREETSRHARRGNHATRDSGLSTAISATYPHPVSLPSRFTSSPLVFTFCSQQRPLASLRRK